MKINLSIISLVALSAMLVTMAAQAATTGTVTATVTVQNISVSVADGTVTYGTLSTSATADTTSTGLNDTQTATNDGNVTEDLNIKGQDSANWTLAGSIGSNQYKHEFCKVDTGDCDGTPVWNALTTNYAALKTGVTTSGTYLFDLKISTPSATTFYTSQSVDVTVQAVSAS